ncbi:hypothetical protein SAMN05421796_101342 [Chryseobacterium piscicola]|uniref:Uncharacterized protein n=1 Tax=Chryseobacterium piscicola TaxID=551459 RepID=A0A1N7K673_9FLAO|nr:hypothetical protein SAMN05421796_101342 [Chryseobacterium piscicola]
MNKNEYHSIYIKKSVTELQNKKNIKIEKISVKKLLNKNVTRQIFHKPITKIINF